MSHVPEYVERDVFAFDAIAEERAAFLRRTYLHLAGAVLAFMFLTYAFLHVEAIYRPLMGLMAHSWWIVLVAFMVVSWIAQRWAHNAVSPGMQYLGLALYTLAEAVIFVPLLKYAEVLGPPNVIAGAAIVTLTMFAGLTLIVFMSGADFSFLRGVLWMGMMAALATIIASMIFGFSLGILFCSAMVLLACGFILYDTSNVLHHYRVDQHVGASLELFASLALLFWYVLQLAMSLDD